MENIEMLLSQIAELISNGEISALRELLTEINVVDTAQLIEELESKDRLLVFRVLPKDISAEVFAYLEPEIQAELVRTINDAELERLLDEMFLDDTVDFLEEVPANVVTRVLAHSDPETRRLINRFLKYPDDCAGSLMTIEMVQLHTSFTAAQAIEHIRKTGVDKETVYTCYCTDRERHLLGSIPLLSLLLCDENELVGDIMEDDAQLISVNTLDDREEVADIVKKYDLLSVPVVDNENRLVGIITVDDIVDVIEEETTEDFEKMASLAPSDNEYLKTGVLKLAKNRIPWLLILMISGTFTGKIIEGYEILLSGFVALTASMPMLMGTSGNAGQQISTLMIRGLAVGEIEIRDYFKVVFKELRVAAICGFILAVANVGRMYLFCDGTIDVYLVVSLAMFFAVIVAKLIGCSLPIFAKLIRLDPALMAGPLISTLLDMITLSIYFALAKVFLLS
ncbi:MAG: magnesium transporter [Oscillospiraceae bacterium]|nr:magnesium transporter [Clostridiaceae bacterium]MDY5949308.1 magnesium transporter [Oscillospiraceae bacterium]